MLYKNRFAPLDDPMFQGASGTYFLIIMGEKESKLQPGEKAEISKRIGWER